jgi:plastocyanin
MSVIFLRKKLTATVMAVTLLCFGHALPGLGVTATVLVGSGGLVFVPATTNIAVNDRVIWSWAGNFHSTTSGTTSGGTATPDGLWDSGVFNAPHSFTNTFSSAGTFPFYCSVHFGSGMKGTIVVTAPNSPPTVTITNPASDAVFAAPANVTIQASAADPDVGGTVTNVQFVVGTTVLTNDNAAPFSAVTNNLAAGSYTLSAIASDNTGAKTTNAVTINVVTPVMTTLSAPVRVPPTNFQFSYSANTGLRYVVQRSTNLLSTNWTAIVTNTAGGSPVTFLDTNATGNPGFYRVGRLPNP